MKRLLRIVDRFRDEHELGQVEVQVELYDGSRLRLSSVSAEPGFGFLTLLPVEEEGEPPRALVVPVGALRVVEISVPDPEQPFGFVATADGSP
ncbi:MAG: hypothetical protein ACRC50_02795 [Gaiella sp.]